MSEVEVDSTVYWFNALFYTFPSPLFNAVLISWFYTHSALLMRGRALYRAQNSKMLFVAEVALSLVLAAVFWWNGELEGYVFYAMVLTLPWTLGLLKYVWENDDLGGDKGLTVRVSLYTLWFIVAVYGGYALRWLGDKGLFYALFSPNLLLIAAPFYLIAQSAPLMLNEFVWATDF